MPIQLVGKILGHTQPQTTYHYLTADNETLLEAVSIFESIQVSNIDDFQIETDFVN